MWGLREDVQDEDVQDEMFPTHVGIARLEGVNYAWIEDVPYACGDCAATLCYPWKNGRCSLRMWGLRDSVHPIQDRDSMFPTHVGIARSRRSSWTERRDVPYACGDCASETDSRLNP